MYYRQLQYISRMSSIKTNICYFGVKIVFWNELYPKTSMNNDKTLKI